MKHLSKRGPEWFYKLPKVVRIAGMAVLGLLFIAIFAVIFGLAVQYLWNWLMPELFGLGTISYWQAIGIVILSKILFGFGPHGKHDRKDDRCKSPMDKTPFHNGDRVDHYHRYWKEEGKEAFEKYMKKIEEGESK